MRRPEEGNREPEGPVVPWLVMVDRTSVYRVMAPADADPDDVIAQYMDEDLKEIEQTTLSMVAELEVEEQ